MLFVRELYYAQSELDCLVASRRHEHVTHEPPRNLDLTKCQGTGEIWSLYRGFVSIGNLDLTNFRENRQNVRYIKV